MPPIRKIPCPLCSNPILPKYVQPSGTCITCEDGKTFYLREHNKKKALLSQERDKLHERLYSMSKRIERLAKEKAAKKAETKELVAERDRLREIYKEQASLALAKRSLLHYIERKKPGFKSNWYTELLANNLEKFYADTAAGKGARLILECAARSGKTEFASDSGPAWCLGNYPDKRIILASFSDDIPIRMSRSVRAQLMSPEFKAIFPNGGRVSKFDSAANMWTTDQGGAFKTTSVSAGLLGNSADILICDDLIGSAAAADSPKLLDDTYDWLTSTAMTRLLPGGSVIVIAQRLSVSDPIGKLIKAQHEQEKELEDLQQQLDVLRSTHNKTFDEQLEQERLEREVVDLDTSMCRWTRIQYPALAWSHEFLTPEGEIVRVENIDDSKPDWRLLRREGEALQPERYTRHYYLQLQRANPSRFLSMMQLSPTSDLGEYISTEDIKRYDPGTHPALDTMHIYCAADLAISTKASADYTCIMCGGVDHEGNLWILDMVHGRYGDLDIVADKLIDMHTKWGATITGIEKSALELALAPILQRKMKERKQYIMLADGKNSLKPIADKKVRARPLQATAKQGKFYVPSSPQFDPYVSELTQFPSGVHDDCLDATAYLSILAARDGLPRDPAAGQSFAKKAKSIWDKLFDDNAKTSESPTYMES